MLLNWSIYSWMARHSVLRRLANSSKIAELAFHAHALKA